MSTQFIREEINGPIATIVLNRPEFLNAWHRPMRDELLAALQRHAADPNIRALVLTGAGNKAFSAGQDLNEAKDFDADRAEDWIDEWDRLYDTIRSLDKPLIVALNGLAAGSAFQVALLADFRIGHPGVRMGQPEINSGIASVTGPWIMREMIGLARTTDLTLSGRMVDAKECFEIGLISRLVAEEAVQSSAQELARELANKPSGAMKLTKNWLREMTEAGFRDAIAGATRIHRNAYDSGEPTREIGQFLSGHRRGS